MQEGTPDGMSAAARLKFGESDQADPGAYDRSNTNMSAAERMKVNCNPYSCINFCLIFLHKS